MLISDKDAERIARDLIAEIALSWEPIPGTRCVKEDDAYLFEYTIEPTEVTRYARRVQRPTSTTFVRFNPLAEATETVIHAASFLDQLDQPATPELLEIYDWRIRQESKQEIHRTLLLAPDVFRDATWQARMIAETLCALESLRKVGRPDIERGLLGATMREITSRFLRRFGEVSRARKPKISQRSISVALQSHLSKFQQTGEIPSQRQFAKTLGVTPKGWRQYLEKQRYPPHDQTVRGLLDVFSKMRSDTVGTISEGDNPKGTISDKESPKGIN